MSEQFDVIIIGSGPAGVHAALPLVASGKHVAIIDGGLKEPDILRKGVPENFTDVRSHNADQRPLFLGTDYSSIPVGGLAGGLGGGMTSGNRSYAVRNAEAHLPINVENGIVIQSLAQGGLGAVWGAACAYLDDATLLEMGLPPTAMRGFYKEVTDIIGVSGPQTTPGVQPPLPLDHHAQSLMERAQKKESQLHKRHIQVMQPHSAVLTRDLGKRTANELTDMDYYRDTEKSVYRPQYTLEALLSSPNLTYLGGNVVERVEETASGVVVFTHATDDKSNAKRFSAQKVIMAAGAVNSARILLRSFDLVDTPIPFVVKPHVLTACIRLGALGKKGPDKRHSLCQLLIVDKTANPSNTPAACAQLYSYRSLLLFRLLQSVPTSKPEALALLSLLAPTLMVADIRFPGMPESGSTLTLTRSEDGSYPLQVNCKPQWSPWSKRALKNIKRSMRSIGLFPVYTMKGPEASTSHYAGTIPCSDDPTLKLNIDQNGKLRQATNIYVADAAGFRMLPPLPHTLTIMANARRIGVYVSQLA